MKIYSKKMVALVGAVASIAIGTISVSFEKTMHYLDQFGVNKSEIAAIKERAKYESERAEIFTNIVVEKNKNLEIVLRNTTNNDLDEVKTKNKISSEESSKSEEILKS